MTNPPRPRLTAGPDDPERRWYGLGIWKRLRLAQLAREPLCAFCLNDDEVTVATVVDHIKPWRRAATRAIRWALFVDPANHQSLCKRHHDSDKKLIENGGGKPKIGLDGWPIE